MAHFIIDNENLENSHPPSVTGLPALLATGRFHHLRFLQLTGLDPQSAQFCFGEFGRFLAMRAESPDQPLRHDRAHGRSHQKWLHTDIDQAGYGGWGIIGVKRTKN